MPNHQNDPPKLELVTGDFYKLDYQILDSKDHVIGETHLEGSMREIIFKLVSSHRLAAQAFERCKKKLPETKPAQARNGHEHSR